MSSSYFRGDNVVAKALLWIVIAIFIIGLLVVIGVFDLIF
jgi:hypothetical protein